MPRLSFRHLIQRGATCAALACALLVLLGLLLSLPGSAAHAAPPTPTPPMNAMRDRLGPPPMPENPTQADLGAQTYYMVCMTCHGDRGQGLNDDFRSVLDPGDRNCWQSRCHASNHPEEGFVFPKAVPAVVTPTIPGRFPTALDLYRYIKVRMPYQEPGSLSDEEYWQITAFLVRANTDRVVPVRLTAESAASVTLAPVSDRPSPGLWVAILALVLALVLLVWSLRRRSRQTLAQG